MRKGKKEWGREGDVDGILGGKSRHHSRVMGKLMQSEVRYSNSCISLVFEAGLFWKQFF